jgi:hypothetical protein
MPDQAVLSPMHLSRLSWIRYSKASCKIQTASNVLESNHVFKQFCEANKTT